MKHGQDPLFSSASLQPPSNSTQIERRRTLLIEPWEHTGERRVVRPAIQGMIGTSEPMRRLANTILKYGNYHYSVLIRGVTGTGKTVAARAIHDASNRATGPWREFNSANFDKELMDSTLFGHERGAFTGATERRIGLFEYADGGTLFFDEIAELPLALQAKLLKVIEEKQLARIGGNETINVDVRVICATRYDLAQMVSDGAFREDLYHRINILQLNVPTLAERREDIPLLIKHYLSGHERKYARATPYTVEPEALRSLYQYAWPGNIRELGAVVQRLAVLVDETGTITQQDVRAVLGTVEAVCCAGERLSDAATIPVPPYRIGEKPTVYLAKVMLYIYNVLLAQTESHTRVARLLETDRVSLYQLLMRQGKRAGIAPSKIRALKGNAQNRAPLKKTRSAKRLEA